MVFCAASSDLFFFVTATSTDLFFSTSLSTDFCSSPERVASDESVPEDLFNSGLVGVGSAVACEWVQFKLAIICIEVHK